jgi:hypothetical protein
MRPEIWLVPTPGIPQETTTFNGAEWKGMIGTDLTSFQTSEAVTCSACATDYTAIISDGTLTAIVNYVTEGDHDEYDHERVFDIIVNNLKRH